MCCNDIVFVDDSLLLRPSFHGQLFFDEDYLSQNFGNEFAFMHSKDYLYYLARSPLPQVFGNDTSPQN